jgi:hypothetical protein
MIETTLISAFPGTGKTSYYNNNNDCLDSDSSKFDKTYFPDNYIEHIKRNVGKVSYIFISSHEEVRKALEKNYLYFTLIYPDISLKSEYLERYKKRGSPDSFISLLDKNWDTWINQLQKQEHCRHIILKSNQFISDVLNIN